MGTEAKPRSGVPFDSERAREAGRRSAEVRRAKREQREATAEENALTFRQRLGVSLSKLTQAQLDERVEHAKPAELVRFADQAFGRPTEAEPDTPTDPSLAELSKEQRAQLRAMLMEGEHSAEGAQREATAQHEPSEAYTRPIDAREDERESDPPPPRG